IEIPWPCLVTQSVPKIIKSTVPPKAKTFTQALNNVCDIPLSQQPQPCLKGDRVAIAIPKDEYMTEIEACKYSLHGRILWPKGATPIKVDALR
ncbi:DUF4283 domain protein, partial [Trifolium medium]|nr:DUF4283 domain protein [Trifolium medium]